MIRGASTITGLVPLPRLPLLCRSKREPGDRRLAVLRLVRRDSELRRRRDARFHGEREALLGRGRAPDPRPRSGPAQLLYDLRGARQWSGPLLAGAGHSRPWRSHALTASSTATGTTVRDTHGRTADRNAKPTRAATTCAATRTAT